MRMEQTGDISRITIEAFTQLRCASSGQANETAELHMGRHTDGVFQGSCRVNRLTMLLFSQRFALDPG
ncbi:hypothetical protein, partial [Pseudomonas syringae]|uniref:hypothetical protein n=1 Tax=Pseudomonas syringae TaxID=317 RepID=UPI001E5496EB